MCRQGAWEVLESQRTSRIIDVSQEEGDYMD
jgi:hypothetical protein